MEKSNDEQLCARLLDPPVSAEMVMYKDLSHDIEGEVDESDTSWITLEGIQG
jgi:hypothetical protein